MKTIQSLYCPPCYGTKVIKNSHKKNGAQNYRCMIFMKQFQQEYLYCGAEKRIKDMAIRMWIRGSGIRDIAYVLGIGTGCVLGILVSQAHLSLTPRGRIYHQVQVDELYSFVHSKKKKVWILYAYCAQSKEILALTMGKRSKKTITDLYKRLRGITVNFWCTDAWPVFKKVFPADSHLIGKRFTKAIEGVNACLINTCKRLIRKTTAFSKKLYNHWCALKLVMYHRNLKVAYI